MILKEGEGRAFQSERTACANVLWLAGISSRVWEEQSMSKVRAGAVEDKGAVAWNDRIYPRAI